MSPPNHGLSIKTHNIDSAVRVKPYVAFRGIGTLCSAVRAGETRVREVFCRSLSGFRSLRGIGGDKAMRIGHHAWAKAQRQLSIRTALLIFFSRMAVPTLTVEDAGTRMWHTPRGLGRGDATGCQFHPTRPSFMLYSNTSVSRHAENSTERP